MNNKIYNLHFFRTIVSNLGRFCALFLIALLGVGFMSGMMSAAPDMRLTADHFFDTSNMYDICVVATLGITAEDISAIKQIDGVRGVMPSRTADAVARSDDGLSKTVRLSSMPFDLLYQENESYLNHIYLSSGRMPQNTEEAVVVIGPDYSFSYKIGDIVTLKSTTGDLYDTFTKTQYTIVGTVESSQYFSTNNQLSQIGSGSIDANLFVRQESFSFDYFTEVYIAVDGADKLDSFNSKYDDMVDNISHAIEKISGERCIARLNSVKKTISSIKKEVNLGKAQLNSAEKELKNAKSQITILENSLPPLEKALNDAKTQYDFAQAEYEERMSQAKMLLDITGAAVSLGNAVVENTENSIAEQRLKIDNLREQGRTYEADAAEWVLDSLLVYYDQVIDEYEGYCMQYEEGLKQFEAIKAEASASLYEINKFIVSSEEQINNAKAQLAEAKKQYSLSEAEFNEQYSSAIEQIRLGEEKIVSLESIITTVGTPTWIINDRDDSEVSYFADNADRISAIAYVFPVFFFLVAALVASATMSRMIEDDRVLIGTFKALGFSRTRIVSKYLIYSGSATLIGSITGVFLGSKLIPSIIWNAYSMIYTLPNMVTPINIVYSSIAVIAMMVCILLMTYLSCLASLKEKPAKLMLPKAPKPGKKVLLERIPFIWKPMSFIHKVTARNIFRYKSRLLMTVLGILGCTALLLTGFALKDSISDIIFRQFHELHTYDAIVGLSDNDNLDDLLDYINSDLGGYSVQHQLNIVVSNGSKSSNSEKFAIADDAENMQKYICLRNRTNDELYTLDDSGVIVTEKLANTLNLKQGNAVDVTYDGITSTFIVTGIVENYVYGYVYITRHLYEMNYGKLEYMNLVNVSFGDTNSEEAISTILRNDSVAMVTSISSLYDVYDNMLKKINAIVWVMIVSAGLLAFVVLFNIINIHITERRREIATLKVLGFFKKEIYAYIFRETAILVIVGDLLGLVAGYFLSQYVIRTAEVDMTMFGREIYPLSYILSFVLTLLFCSLVFIMTAPKIKAINMIESLKSTE